MFDAFLFDLDGTLLDSEALWIDAIGRALQERGIAISHAAVTELVLGRSWPDIFADIQRRFPNVYADRAEIEAITVPLYKHWVETRDVRIHSSIDLLRRLAKLAPTVIVSGSTRDRIAESIELMDIEDLVPFHIGAEDYTAGKPDPACFLMAAEQLRVLPEHCLVFEDSPAGVVAAKAAGMTCVALHRQDTPPPAGADLVLADLGAFSFDLLPHTPFGG
ncbi:MAG: HAD family phosphatase [Victivallales bacterium]|jgi:HAD superfamily hydrolase (TIGR01509 family)|nr:HAD family phosphatase [Victivallales bacterium]